MNSLDELRDQIDRIDDDILRLLNARAEKAHEVKNAKGGGVIYRPEREASIVRRMTGQKHTLPGPSRAAIYREIIAACRNLEQQLRVSYLGPAGSYSHEAALALAGSSSELIAATSITATLRAAEHGDADAALLPIENSSEGMVSETHKLLRGTGLKIIAEIVLPINHCLLSKEKSLDGINVVYAHPQALGQCRQWLQTHLPGTELVAEPSNSRAAEVAAKSQHAAAIASAKAAELFNLRVHARNINDEPANQTRFVLLGKELPSPTGHDQTSLICLVKNTPGALHGLLAVFADAGINMTRLESQPVSASEYAFYIDLDGHQSESNISTALARAAEITISCTNLGSYPKAEKL